MQGETAVHRVQHRNVVVCQHIRSCPRKIIVEKSKDALSSRLSTPCATWRRVSNSHPDAGPAEAIRICGVDIVSRIAKYGLLLRSLREKRISPSFIAAEYLIYTHSYGRYRQLRLTASPSMIVLRFRAPAYIYLLSGTCRLPLLSF